MDCGLITHLPSDFHQLIHLVGGDLIGLTDLSGDGQDVAILFEHLDMEIRLLERSVEGYRAVICKQDRIGAVADMQADGLRQGLAAGGIVSGDEVILVQPTSYIANLLAMLLFVHHYRAIEIRATGQSPAARYKSVFCYLILFMASRMTFSFMTSRVVFALGLSVVSPIMA